MRTLLALFFLGAVVLFSCKKKDKEEAPAPTPVTPPPHIYAITAKLNGAEWKNGYSGDVNYTVASRSGNYYYFAASKTLSSSNDGIALSFTPSVGTYTLAKYGQFVGRYTTAAGVDLKSVNGTLTITQLDTSASYGLPKILKATFNFMTDTVAGESYNVTEGVVDYKSN